MMTAFARTVILYFLIMAGLRLMGKRQIGELEPGELVLTMMISDLATVPMQDFGIPLLAGVIPILTLLALSMLLSQLSLTSLRFRRAVCGTPSVLIRQGVLQQEAMRRNRYTLDELLEELLHVDDSQALTAAAYFHVKFENIHPFADGNGRVGRLAMNYLLVCHNHPPVVIHQEDRREYFTSLEAWDTGQDLKPMLSFLRDQTVKTWEKQIKRKE